MQSDRLAHLRSFLAFGNLENPSALCLGLTAYTYALDAFHPAKPPSSKFLYPVEISVTMERLLNLSHSPSFHIGDGDIFRYSPSSSSFLSTSLASLKSIILLYLSIVPSLFHLTLTILLLITLSFVFNYTFTQVLFYTQHRRSDAVKVPPTIPYMIPYLGSTLSFGYNALNWVASSS